MSSLSTNHLIMKSRLQKENLRGYQVDTTLLSNNSQSNTMLLPRLQANITSHT